MIITNKQNLASYFVGSIIGTSSVLGQRYMFATCFFMVSCRSIKKKVCQERDKEGHVLITNLNRFEQKHMNRSFIEELFHTLLTLITSTNQY